MGIYNYTVKDSLGNNFSFNDYKDYVILIVNTACEWGLTPHFQGLEALYKEYKDKKFLVAAFPCNQFGGQDPGTNEEIRNFAQSKYGVSFPIMAKIEVNGENTEPIFSFLKKASNGEDIKWNFAKFLVDKTGERVTAYAPTVAPEDLKKDIEKLLN